MQKKKVHIEHQALKEVLSGMNSRDVDQLVHPIAEEETKKIDCTSCGKCCQVLQPPFTALDIQQLEEVKSSLIDLLVLDPSNQQHYLKQSPCHFLCKNKCTVYKNRPQACADYPHLHQPHFKYRFNSVMENYEVCPIVYHTVERLKLALNVC